MHLAFQNEEHVVRYIPLSYYLLLAHTESSLHALSNIHNLLLLSLLKHPHTVDLLIVNMMDHLVPHVRVQHPEELLGLLLESRRLFEELELVAVLHYLLLKEGRHFVDLERVIDVVAEALHLFLVVNGLLHLGSDATEDDGDQVGADD